MRCFVAMAFGRKDTDMAYKKLIAPTLRALKITAVRVDRIEHLEDINNKIMAELEKCDIALADLTYARPSVYFEAGYAQRSVPVVYTCRSDHLSGRANDKSGNLRVHFDLRMKNIIPWSSPRDTQFGKKLERRVRFAVLPILRDRKNVKETQRDEYVQFGDKSGHIRTDALAILKELDFRHPKNIVVKPSEYWTYASRYSKNVLSTTKKIGIVELGFPRTFRFLIDFLNEWPSVNTYTNEIRAKHDSDEYGNIAYNNIWVEVSYGKFRESSLKSRFFSHPRGFTTIPINAHLSYLGTDRTTLQFEKIDNRTVSKLKNFSSIIGDKRLSNHSILENIRWVTSKLRDESKRKAAEKELNILSEKLGERLDFSFMRHEESRPGFVISNIRSKDAIRSNMQLMLDWIARNGHWM